jgi:hypothetical protein
MSAASQVVISETLQIIPRLAAEQTWWVFLVDPQLEPYFVLFTRKLVSSKPRGLTGGGRSLVRNFFRADREKYRDAGNLAPQYETIRP